MLVKDSKRSTEKMNKGGDNSMLLNKGNTGTTSVRATSSQTRAGIKVRVLSEKLPEFILTTKKIEAVE